MVRRLLVAKIATKNLWHHLVAKFKGLESLKVQQCDTSKLSRACMQVVLCPVREGIKKKNVPFSSLLLLRGPATPPPLVVPWAIKILGPYFFVK